MSSFAGVPCVIYGFSNASGGLQSGGPAGVCASGFGNWSYSKAFYGFYPSGSPNISKSVDGQPSVGSNPTRSATSPRKHYVFGGFLYLDAAPCSGASGLLVQKSRYSLYVRKVCAAAPGACWYNRQGGSVTFLPANAPISFVDNP